MHALTLKRGMKKLPAEHGDAVGVAPDGNGVPVVAGVLVRLHFDVEAGNARFEDIELLVRDQLVIAPPTPQTLDHRNALRATRRQSDGGRGVRREVDSGEGDIRQYPDLVLAVPTRQRKVAATVELYSVYNVYVQNTACRPLRNTRAIRAVERKHPFRAGAQYKRHTRAGCLARQDYDNTHAVQHRPIHSLFER